jgi:superfamily II DNA or RNA helicase
MKSPVQYSHELEDALKEGPNSKAKLTQLEQSLQLDLHALRMQFKGREVSALQQSARKSGSEKAEQQKRLAEENEARTKAYQELLDQVKKALGS